MNDPASGGLFAAPAGRRRSPAAVAASAALHVAAAVALVALARVAPLPKLPREHRALSFVVLAPLPVPRESLPPVTLPAPAVHEEPARSIVAPQPDVAPPPPRVEARAEPRPVPPALTRPAPPATFEAPKPASPPVTVGLFADTANTSAHATEPAKVLHAAGFDTPSPVAKSPDPKSGVKSGAFDLPVEAPPRGDRRASVAAAGFGASRVERSTVKPVTEVRTSGFEDARSAHAPATRVQPRPARVDIPVEIIFKPAPIYSDEARALKLEGEVLLDVEFAASGTVTVLQVVRGLGHGLDEAAASAATQIRFKPAQAAGRPVDFRTTVHIVFRLA